VIFSASRPFFAVQKSFASTATPFGMVTTSVTPFTARAALSSTDATLPPKRGGWATTAVSMPGSFTSCVKIALPFVFDTLSTRGAARPISVKSFGSFSVTSAGTGCLPAASASSPKPAFFPLAACDTTPAFTVIWPAGTFHCAAAAPTSMARAVAPARRICSNELAIAVLPPVPCAGPQNRLL
jgi:hypothetical protein